VAHRLFARAIVVCIACVPAPALGRADGEPVKLAAMARFDISADENADTVDQGQVVAGNGIIARKNWVPQAEQARGYTVSFPVAVFAWRQIAIRFKPVRSGAVAVVLMGPFEEASQGVIFRQEVLWDDLRAEGAQLKGGGFESAAGDADLGWHGAGTVVRQSNDFPAVEGAFYARTWHNATLSTMIEVTAGKPVTITVNARAARPDNFREMKRIAGRSTPAHIAARRYLRGINLANDLEAPPGQNWGTRHAPADLDLIRKEGFDHVRIPIAWHHYTGPGPKFLIRPEIFTRVDPLVRAGLSEGLAVIVDIHHFEDFTLHPKEQTDRLIAIWSQVAEHFADSPAGLAFEVFNEPKDAAKTLVMNPIIAAAIKEIRRTNPARTIFVGPGSWNSIFELSELWLPDDDNLIVTVHNYEPYYLTHQGAPFTGPDTKTTGIRFPGPPPSPLVPDPKLTLNSWVVEWIKSYNTQPTASNPSSPMAFRGAIELAGEWSQYYGRPVHLGEFGCNMTADAESRAHYYRAVRESVEQAGLGWAAWDWKAGFRYWNARAARPEPGMSEALFGKTPARQKERAATALERPER
jgi:endoglucanase